MRLFRVLHNRFFLPLKVLCRDVYYHNGTIGIYRFISTLFRGTSIGVSTEKKLNNKIIDKLGHEFHDLLAKYQDESYDVFYDSNAPIWVLWLQGYEKAPDIVKKCINSIKASTSHPVKLISANSISDYYDLPEYIMKKYADGKISNAQFSDILRMSFLSKYGGLWVDATIFIPKMIPEDIFKKEFYTCKRDIKDSGYVSECRWTSFLIGCQKGCVIQRAAKDLLFAYWKKYNYLIDYLLIDYVLLLIYKQIPKAKCLIDDLSYNNPKIEELQNRMNDAFDERIYRTLITDSDTNFFKLSWRMNFETQTSDGKLTMFGFFMGI